MALFFSPDPSHDDIKDFMDDDQRRDWDTQKGTPEERVEIWESLESLWRSIPDPTEAELEQVMGPNWGHVQRGENREGILNHYRRKWKKDRKAAEIAHQSEWEIKTIQPGFDDAHITSSPGPRASDEESLKPVRPKTLTEKMAEDEKETAQRFGELSGNRAPLAEAQSDADIEKAYREDPDIVKLREDTARHLRIAAAVLGDALRPKLSELPPDGPSTEEPEQSDPPTGKQERNEQSAIVGGDFADGEITYITNYYKPEQPSTWSVRVQRGLLAVAAGVAWWLFEKFDVPVFLGILTLAVCLVSAISLRWLEKTERRKKGFVAFLVIYALLAIIAAIGLSKLNTEKTQPLPTSTSPSVTLQGPTFEVKPSPARVLLNKTPRQLLSLYEKNDALRARELMKPFEGEWMRIEGRLQQLTEKKYVYVVLLRARSGNHNDLIALSFEKNEDVKHRLLQLAEGDVLIVECRLAEEQERWFLTLTGCEFPHPVKAMQPF